MELKEVTYEIKVLGVDKYQYEMIHDSDVLYKNNRSIINHSLNAMFGYTVNHKPLESIIEHSKLQMAVIVIS